MRFTDIRYITVKKMNVLLLNKFSPAICLLKTYHHTNMLVNASSKPKALLGATNLDWLHICAFC